MKIEVTAPPLTTSPVKRKNKKMLRFKSYEISQQPPREASADETITQATDLRSTFSRVMNNVGHDRA